MPRTGTFVICVQNLDFSGANQVVLNIVHGRMHNSNIVVVSPKAGTFAARFVETGASIRIGNSLDAVLKDIRDVFCVLCNTIMTADIVVHMAQTVRVPTMWIIHEWWTDEMIIENLKIRNLATLTLNTVKLAMKMATMIVFVCENQRALYHPEAASSVIFVGVPSPQLPPCPDISAPFQDDCKSDSPSHHTIRTNPNLKVFTFLVLGIICPRKNQTWAVDVFQQFVNNHEHHLHASNTSLRLLIVGARYTRAYEVEYLQKLNEAVEDFRCRRDASCIPGGGGHSIEVHDVTDHVDQFYNVTDVLLVTSLNEVTPMVIPEALAWGIPVIATNIAGIPEMFQDGIEGFLVSPDDNQRAIECMYKLVHDKELNVSMGEAAKQRFEKAFSLESMVNGYRELILKVSPPTILIDMDGVLVDWDAGFMSKWSGCAADIDRSKSYYMEQCVHPERYREVELIYQSEEFFRDLPPMKGGLAAVREMVFHGFNVFICTAPVLTSRYCAQEKIDWIRKHLGESWLDKIILVQDKTTVKGDILVDDKPFEKLSPHGKHNMATWQHVMFDAPYNQIESDLETSTSHARLYHWKNWKEVIIPLIVGGNYFSEHKEVCNFQNPPKRVYSDLNIDLTSLDRNHNDRHSMQLNSSPRSLQREKERCMRLPAAQERMDMFLGTSILNQDMTETHEPINQNSPDESFNSKHSQSHSQALSRTSRKQPEEKIFDLLSLEDAASITGTGSFFNDEDLYLYEENLNSVNLLSPLTASTSSSAASRYDVLNSTLAANTATATSTTTTPFISRPISTSPDISPHSASTATVRNHQYRRRMALIEHHTAFEESIRSEIFNQPQNNESSSLSDGKIQEQEDYSSYDGIDFRLLDIRKSYRSWRLH